MVHTTPPGTTVEECRTLIDGRDVPRVRVTVSDHEPNPNLQIALDKIKEFCTSQENYESCKKKTA